MSAVPTLNPDSIQALRDLSPEGDSEFLRELIGIYLDDSPKRLAQLEEAIARQDAAMIIRSAHTLKGSSGNFGAEQFAKIAQEIETHAKAGNMAAAAAGMPALKSAFEQVTAALQQLARS
jgi:HPt (histidine-containing phosphotransfer) domain-containing protein